jgi:hypothetical protein
MNDAQGAKDGNALGGNGITSDASPLCPAVFTGTTDSDFRACGTWKSDEIRIQKF